MLRCPTIDSYGLGLAVPLRRRLSRSRLSMAGPVYTSSSKKGISTGEDPAIVLDLWNDCASVTSLS